jgi:NAD+ kinase
MKLILRSGPVGIVTKSRAAGARKLLRKLTGFLERRGVPYLCDPASAALLGERGKSRTLPVLAESVKLLVVLGGDGTLLGVARSLPERPAPVLGVNLGKLGFLTETALGDLDDVLSEVLEGRFRVEERMMLEARVMRGNRVIATSRLLNDVVINKSALARILEMDVRIDGQFVAIYHADGLIVATPTGSTAYSLSAGGPIVLPGLKAFCITPICPHALTNRPLVVPDSVTIQVTLESESPDVYCTMDGQVGLPLKAGDRVRVKRSATTLPLIVPRPRNYFDVLRNKLRWGAR